MTQPGVDRQRCISANRYGRPAGFFRCRYTSGERQARPTDAAVGCRQAGRRLIQSPLGNCPCAVIDARNRVIKAKRMAAADELVQRCQGTALIELSASAAKRSGGLRCACPPYVPSRRVDKRSAVHRFSRRPGIRVISRHRCTSAIPVRRARRTARDRHKASSARRCVPPRRPTQTRSIRWPRGSAAWPAAIWLRLSLKMRDSRNTSPSI
jgi:hypothetical protein